MIIFIFAVMPARKSVMIENVAHEVCWVDKYITLHYMQLDPLRLRYRTGRSAWVP